jgi:HPt (histidine-containing phosphotransfer) domain-containing protein
MNQTQHLPPPIDLSTCLRIANQDTEIVKKLLSMFISELPGEKLAINQAFETGNYNLLRTHTHKLLGSGAYCGAQYLQSTLMSLSKHAKENNQDALEKELHQFNQCVQDIMDYYRKNILGNPELGSS